MKKLEYWEAKTSPKVNKLVNWFIERTMPESFDHYADNDENDGQRLRVLLFHLLQKEREKAIKDFAKYALKTGYFIPHTVTALKNGKMEIPSYKWGGVWSEWTDDNYLPTGEGDGYWSVVGWANFNERGGGGKGSYDLLNVKLDLIALVKQYLKRKGGKE